MGNYKLRGKDLSALGFTTNISKSIAIHLVAKYGKHLAKQAILQLLQDLATNPNEYVNDEIWGKLAAELLPPQEIKSREEIQLAQETGLLKVYGRKGIAANAFQQMELAMRLPISVQGALMPDAHQGYGLPIGGVLATKNAVIPYGVGMDIGCRMSLTLYEADEKYLNRHSYSFKQSLKNRTCFGTGGEFEGSQEHEVLESPVFQELDLLKRYRTKAARQLGTSGSGNHFVEWGAVSLQDGNDFGLAAGKYIGLLAHSGSRGLGATIARYYTQLALQSCLLPKGARHLAWLELDSEAGQEYWLAMNLAGDYAKACHDHIHKNVADFVGLKPVAKVENHHNFAWREKLECGEEVIVHRKGATPAKMGELGIIPGTMSSPAFIVRGKGIAQSLQSASHGAGRKLSRQKARSTVTRSAMNKHLKQMNIDLIGGGPDEAPLAYKDIHEVMRNQQDLVESIGTFLPRIVRMDKN